MQSTGTAKATAKDLVLRMYEMINTRQFDRFDEIVAEDFVAEWPQSKERVVGRSNFLAILRSYPGEGPRLSTTEIEFTEGDEGTYLLTPLFTAVKAEGSGDTATSTMCTTYPDGSDWYVITIAKAHNGKLVHNTAYFAPVYDAPEWRAQWVERM